MILNDVFSEVFKVQNVPGQRKYIRFVNFVRDPKTGLHGLIVFKNQEYQVWAISNYGEALNAVFNQNKVMFNSPLIDIQHLGRGNDLSIVATNALSKVHIFQFDNESEQLISTTITIPNVLFTRQLPSRSALIAATSDGKLAKYSTEGHLQTLVEIPNCPLPKSVAISNNGKTAVVGDRSGNLSIFDIESMEILHTVETLSGPINVIEFTPDGNRILIGGKQLIQLYSYEELAAWSYTKAFVHHTDNVTSINMCLGSNVERFASASHDGSVCIWSLTEEEPLHVIQLKDEMPTSINFSPDGLYLIIATDESSIRIYRTSFTGDFNEPQYFIDEHTMKANFFDLEGNSIFNPRALRKSLNMYGDGAESLIFLKMELNPQLKLREAYHMVTEANEERFAEQNTTIRALRRERKLQRRVIAFQVRSEQLRLAALREGRDFEAPEMPSFSEIDENLDELSDIEAMFEVEEPVVETKPTNGELPDPFSSSTTSPALSQPKSDVSRDDDDGAQQMQLDLGILSSSDDDEPHQNMNEDSQAKSPASNTNQNGANESPKSNQLWASDDDDIADPEQQQQIQSPVNKDVEMEDVSQVVDKSPVSAHESAASSPLASPPINHESP